MRDAHAAQPRPPSSPDSSDSGSGAESESDGECTAGSDGSGDGAAPYYDATLWDAFLRFERDTAAALELAPDAPDAPLDPAGSWCSVDERRLDCASLRVLRNLEIIGKARAQSSADLSARRFEWRRPSASSVASRLATATRTTSASSCKWTPTMSWPTPRSRPRTAIRRTREFPRGE